MNKNVKKPHVLKNEKNVTSRNYFIVLVVSILFVAIALYIRSFTINLRENVNNNSVFTNNVQSININDIDYTIPETAEAIIYVGYRGNSKVISMEKNLYKTIENKELKDKVIYIDTTDKMDNNEYISIFQEKFPNISDEINTAPLFIYIRDGKAVEAMSSELKLVDYKVFNKIVEKYEIE